MTGTNKFIAELEDRIDDLEGDVEGYKEDILDLEGHSGELEDALLTALDERNAAEQRAEKAEADRDLYLEDFHKAMEQVDAALKDWEEEKQAANTWMNRCFQARHELQEMRNALRTLAGER